VAKALGIKMAPQAIAAAPSLLLAAFRDLAKPALLCWNALLLGAQSSPQQPIPCETITIVLIHSIMSGGMSYTGLRDAIIPTRQWRRAWVPSSRMCRRDKARSFHQPAAVGRKILRASRSTRAS
jgi:hypothetical protein